MSVAHVRISSTPTPTSSTTRLPRSGNAALAAGAFIQVALGVEFVLAGTSKILDRDFANQFRTFVQASPAARQGPLAPLLQGLVLPNAAVAAQLATFVELGAGLVLLLSAI